MSAAPPGSPGDDNVLRITPGEVDALASARSWINVTYVLGLIFAVVGGLAGIAVAGLGPMPGLSRAGVGFGVVLVLGVMIFYLGLLRRYIKGIDAHVQRRDPAGLTRAFRALKGWWMFMVVGAVISIGSSVVMIIAQLVRGAPLGR